jgi:hypothetical protein
MNAKNALTLSIGVLGAVAVVLTAEVITVPVWVVFIAWASFFILGGGVSGLVRSVASNLTGVVIASVCLLIGQQAELGIVLTAIVVGIGSGLMVAVSRVPLLAAIPAIVWGFASTVGTVAVTGRDISYTASIGNPVLVVATALVLGGVFGIASERLAAALTSKDQQVAAATAPEGTAA